MRIGYLTSHPIQYQAPLFRLLANTSGVSLKVYFAHRHGVERSFDAGFGREILYDVPLLGGFDSEFLPNISWQPSLGFWGQINPAILTRILNAKLDALIIHGYSALTNLMAISTAVIPAQRRPRLLMRGESHLREPRRFAVRAGKEILVRGLLNAVDHCLAIGSLNADYWHHYGVPRERITVAPYAVDNDFFRQASTAARENRAAVREKYKLPTDRPLFLFCGKLISIKRPQDAIHALAKARAVGRCGLVLAGTGAMENELREKARQLSVADDVFFLGFVNQSELPSIYGACDALVLPSSKEPWGLVINEAMACSMAIASSANVGAAADLVKENGIVFPVGDIKALASAMISWVQQPAELARMRAASARIIQEWGLSQSAAAMVNGVERALAS